MRSTVDLDSLTPEGMEVVLSEHPELGSQVLGQTIEQGRNDLFDTLLRRVAIDINQPIIYDITPLHHAVEHARPDMVKRLCELGADINATKDNGWTPLHLAVDVEADGAHQEERAPGTRLLEILLAAGADPSIRDEEGNTALDLAEEWEHEAAVRLLARAKP